MQNVESQYDELFSNGLIKEMLDKSEYFIINTYSLLIKNNFFYSEDEKENMNAMLLAISSLAKKFSIFNDEISAGYISRLLLAIKSTINEYLSAYGQNGLLELLKSNEEKLDLFKGETAIYLAYKENINLDGFLSKTVDKRKSQIDRYGEYLAFLPVDFKKLPHKLSIKLSKNHINHIADIYDIYYEYQDSKLTKEELKEIYDYLNNEGFDLNDRTQYIDKKVDFLTKKDYDNISDEEITNEIIKIQNRINERKVIR